MKEGKIPEQFYVLHFFFSCLNWSSFCESVFHYAARCLTLNLRGNVDYVLIDSLFLYSFFICCCLNMHGVPLFYVYVHSSMHREREITSSFLSCYHSFSPSSIIILLTTNCNAALPYLIIK